MKYIMILTACSNRPDARLIIDALLSAKLAACVQEQEVNSHYIWKGKPEHENEVLLFIKTKESLYNRAESLIKSLHKYETPEIIALPVIAGSESYLKWIDGTLD